MSIKPSRHRARKLCQRSIQLVNEAVLSSAPSDKFPTILQAQEDCSLTIELELLNLTGTRWASHACTLLPMLELFEQLKSRGTSQMTWHHLKCRLIWWPQPGTISARDSTSDAFNFCISRSGCGRCIATQWFWAALHLINLPPMSKWRSNPTNLVCSGYRTSAFAVTWRMLRTRCPSMRGCLHRGCVPILHECIPWPHRADVPPNFSCGFDCVPQDYTDTFRGLAKSSFQSWRFPIYPNPAYSMTSRLCWVPQHVFLRFLSFWGDSMQAVLVCSTFCVYVLLARKQHRCAMIKTSYFLYKSPNALSDAFNSSIPQEIQFWSPVFWSLPFSDSWWTSIILPELHLDLSRSHCHHCDLQAETCVFARLCKLCAWGALYLTKAVSTQEPLKWSWCTLPDSSKCQVPLLQSLGRAQIWTNALGVCLKIRTRFN